MRYPQRKAFTHRFEDGSTNPIWNFKNRFATPRRADLAIDPPSQVGRSPPSR